MGSCEGVFYLFIYLPELAWNWDLPDLSLACRWDESTHHHTQILVEIVSHELFSQAGFKL
jgi:hypothetical protein